MTKLKNIQLNITSFQGFDLAQYLINSLEYIQKMEVKNGGLTYTEKKSKKNFS